MEALAQERAAKREKDKQEGLKRLMRDMKLAPKGEAEKVKARGKANGIGKQKEKEDDEEDQGDWQEEYEGDGQIVDPVRTSPSLLTALSFADAVQLLFCIRFARNRTQTKNDQITTICSPMLDSVPFLPEVRRAPGPRGERMAPMEPSGPGRRDGYADGLYRNQEDDACVA